MDGEHNSGDHTTEELKKTLRKSPPKKNPNMSSAEMKLKFDEKKN